MNRLLTALFAGTLLATAGTASAAPQDFTSTVATANSDSKADSSFSRARNSARQLEEICRVAKGAGPRGGLLDPRVERFFRHSIPSNTQSDYEFSGFFTIDSAHDTTVMQILNLDRDDPDRYRPVLFLEANRFTNRDGDDILVITDGRMRPGNPQIRWQRNDNDFHLRVKVIDGRSVEVYIDGRLRYTKVLDRYNDRPGVQRGDQSQIRYGAYHHDTRVVGPASNRTKEALSEAKIRVRDALFTRL